MNRVNMKMTCARAFIVLLVIQMPVLAADKIVNTPMSSSTGLLQATLGLIIVIALILGSAWLLKKINPHITGNSIIKVITATSVGHREKVVIIEVNNDWLVLGVTTSQINLLQTIPRHDQALPETPDISSSFMMRIKEAAKQHGYC